jgi:hypothetical protein
VTSLDSPASGLAARDQLRTTSPIAPPAWDTSLNAAQLNPLRSAALQQILPGLLPAFDEQAMAVALQAAIFDQAHPKATIESCELDQATYIPSECCVLRYLLTLKDSTNGQTRDVLVSGRVLPDHPTRAGYIDNRLMPLLEPMAGREELAPFDTPVATVEPLHMAVHAFPIDGELPTLVGATDRRRLVGILREVLSETEQPHPIEDCRVELVDYGRQHRCTLRYHISGPQASGDMHKQLVYGKLTGDGSGAFAGSISSALRERVRDSADGFFFNVPHALAWRPELQLSLLEAIPGEPLAAELVKARLRDKPAAPGALSLEHIIDTCARIAATLHTSGISLGRPRALGDEAAALRQAINHIQPISPEFGARLVAYLDWLISYESRSDALPVCFNHGDFTHGQLLFDVTTSGLVDFDSVCQAEPALDIGQFLTYLRITSLKSRLTPAATRVFVEQLGDRFMDTYIAATGDPAGDSAQLHRRVSVYKAISLLRRAVRSWQKFKPDRIDGALTLLEEQCAALS